MDTSAKTRVLIVGAGFGGIKAALRLCKSKHFDVTILSDTPYFSFFPAVYRTATGGIINQLRIPLSSILTGKNVTFMQASADRLDRKARQIITTDGRKITYDVLILALGSVTNYFGIKGAKEVSYTVKTPSGIKRFKNHLHSQLESAHQPDLNYVVVGGGPTGIELSSSLVGYLKETMRAHGIKGRTPHVDLVEASPRLLPSMPESLSRAVARRLRRLGVKLYLGKAVEGADDDSIVIDGKPIQSHTIIWTAGVANHPFFTSNGFKTDGRHKVIVDDYLEAEPDIYVIGDNAGTVYSGMAQTALHDGAFVSDNLRRWAEASLMQRYEPKRPIYIFPVGRRWAAVSWGKLQLSGFAGWVLHLLADLYTFGSYEPWLGAGKQWLTEFETEEDCTVCREHARKF